MATNKITPRVFSLWLTNKNKILSLSLTGTPLTNSSCLSLSTHNTLSLWLTNKNKRPIFSHPFTNQLSDSLYDQKKKIKRKRKRGPFPLRKREALTLKKRKRKKKQRRGNFFFFFEHTSLLFLPSSPPSSSFHKPSTFTPSSKTPLISQITSAVNTTTKTVFSSPPRLSFFTGETSAISLRHADVENLFFAHTFQLFSPISSLFRFAKNPYSLPRLHSFSNPQPTTTTKSTTFNTLAAADPTTTPTFHPRINNDKQPNISDNSPSTANHTPVQFFSNHHHQPAATDFTFLLV